MVVIVVVVVTTYWFGIVTRKLCETVKRKGGSPIILIVPDLATCLL